MASREIITIFVLASIMLLMTLVEAVLEEYRFNRALEVFVRVAIYGFLALSVVLMLGSAAAAHDHGHPELNDWLKTLRSPDGGPCCDGSDVEYLDDPEWRLKNGNYEAFMQGAWRVIPDGNVVKEPNKLHMAVIWPYYQNGEMKARCFLPGGMG